MMNRSICTRLEVLCNKYRIILIISVLFFSIVIWGCIDNKQSPETTVSYKKSIVPQQHDLKTYREPLTDMEFAYIKGGCFKMGSPEWDKESENDERPVHEVCLEDFYISIYEVTNKDYKMFRPNHDSEKYGDYLLNMEKQPVVNVSWDDAVAYAEWLSQKTDKEYRLPRESEWEYAARGGNEMSRYWGNDSAEACNYANVYDVIAKNTFNWIWDHHHCEDGYAASAPVGRFRPNVYGVYDMLGNVWEWVYDKYETYPFDKSSLKASFKTHPLNDRSLRGGSWLDEPKTVRSSNRRYITPSFKSFAIGFRIVKSIEENNNLQY